MNDEAKKKLSKATKENYENGVDTIKSLSRNGVVFNGNDKLKIKKEVLAFNLIEAKKKGEIIVDPKYKINECIFSNKVNMKDGNIDYKTTLIFENGKISSVMRKYEDKQDHELAVLYAYLQGTMNLSKIAVRKRLLRNLHPSEIKSYLYVYFAERNLMEIEEAEEYIKGGIVV